MILFHLYRTPALSAYQTAGLLATAQAKGLSRNYAGSRPSSASMLPPTAHSRGTK